MYFNKIYLYLSPLSVSKSLISKAILKHLDWKIFHVHLYVLYTSSCSNNNLAFCQSFSNHKRAFSNHKKLKIINRMYDWNNLPKPNVIFVLGGPGAGKGTQCSIMSKEFGYVHLSAGDLLRLEQNTPGSEYGNLIAEHIKNGTIVPVEITCRLLMNSMLETMRSLAEKATKQNKPIPKGNFLIDGFPRNQNNLDGWKQFVDDKVNVQFVIFFECPQEVYIERCLKRGKHSGRADDNPESVKKRLDTYLNQTMPIIEYYEKLNMVKRIDSSRSISDVNEDCRKLLIPLMENQS